MMGFQALLPPLLLSLNLLIAAASADATQRLVGLILQFFGFSLSAVAAAVRRSLSSRWRCDTVVRMMGFQALLPPLLSLNLLIAAASAGQSKEVCVSPGGRFPPFSSEGKPPRKVAKGPRDLAFCRVFRQNTCCDIAQTYPALLSIRRLASSGEANQECLHLWELLECSICDPRVGVQPGPPLICTSLCDMILQACLDAYFAIDAKTQVLSPCGLSDIVCGRAREWASNGTELCQLAGFSVQQSEVSYQGADEHICYGGKASLESIADSWKKPQSGSPLNGEKISVLDDIQQWVREMPITERVSWAVGGMVLTAGLLFISKRKSYNHRQKQTAMRHTARRLANQQSFGTLK